ncbi:MAG: M20/M25/M40 family metallo-hydrolase [Clostridia bacterium]|nr:M20/M25/M40 family metallo-hydrolase [Clostridia bacterium]
MLNLIKALNNCPSVSGREKAISDKITGFIAPFCDKVWEDAMGNLIAVKYGNGEDKKKIMLCAHMDEIGFMVTHIEESGLLRITTIGGINFVSACYSYVVSERGVKGILVPNAGTAPSDLRADTVYIDIGAKDKKDAEKKVKLGDFFTARYSVEKIGRRICGRPMDDRIGCVALIQIAEKLAETGCKNDVYFCFSVQEEVGCRGAKTAAFAIAPDYGIAFDVTATGDTPGAKPMACSVGGGAAIKIKDSSVICDKLVVDKMVEIAKAHEIKYQCEILLAGGTDTSAMQVAGAGAHAGALSIPTRYIHSNVEMIDADDVTACVELAVAFVQEI